MDKEELKRAMIRDVELLLEAPITEVSVSSDHENSLSNGQQAKAKTTKTMEELKAIERQKGHRLRQKNLFMKEGILSWPEHHILELVLIFAVSRKDTKQLAWDLLEHFGSLKNVLDADPKALEGMKGLGEHSVCLLKLIPALCSVYLGQTSKSSYTIRTSLGAFEIFRGLFLQEQNEKVMILCLDGDFKLIDTRVVGEGGLMSAVFDIRRIVTEVVVLKAVHIYVAHNHVISDTKPSKDDWDATETLLSVLNPMNIYLMDHLVISGNEMTSMKEVEQEHCRCLAW